MTGWSREELIGKKYIFEVGRFLISRVGGTPTDAMPRDQLFDTSSVVEYYESFAKHAFESTSSSIMTQCVILGPSGRPVPCAFCFSVRRDLFSVRAGRLLLRFESLILAHYSVPSSWSAPSCP